MASSDLEELELKPPFAIISNLINDNEIQRFKFRELSYNDFYWRFMERNCPVVLMDVSTHWECRRNWLKSVNKTLQQKNQLDNKIVPADLTPSSIDFDYLKEKVGNCQVPVANCNKEYYNSHEKSEMAFHDFLLYWQKKRKNSKEDVKSCTATELSNLDKTTTTEDLLYLKDWHLKAQNTDYDFYKVPKHFASDWLNEYLVDMQSDDYRFVYMGPKDTWTPFHSDVFGSFSWSTNILGIKKWLLLPSGEEIKLYDSLGNLPFSINERILEEKNVKFVTIMQSENESLFVPSGWYHQVWNITDTISVNHNWFNACNLLRIWKNLNNQMEKVIKEIDDCRQMDNFMEHCQTMLRASFGLNYLEFLSLLKFITNRRLRKLNNNTASNVPSLSSPPYDALSSNLIFSNQFIPNDYHIKHDIERILQVIELMLQDSVICDDRIVLYRQCVELKEMIDIILRS